MADRHGRSATALEKRIPEIQKLVEPGNGNRRSLLSAAAAHAEDFNRSAVQAGHDVVFFNPGDERPVELFAECLDRNVLRVFNEVREVVVSGEKEALADSVSACFKS